MTKKDTWALLKEEYEEFSSEKCKNVNKEELTNAENKLGVKFSDSFKYFLKNHEVSSIGELYIFTLTRSKSPRVFWSIMDSNRWYKIEQQWPNIEDWCIISDNGSGDPIGIKPNGEVWISYHDSGFEQEKLADDFEEFVYKLLTETLWD